MSTSSNPLRIDIEGFQVLSVLGKGGFATVYRAVHTLDNTQVALKVLHPMNDAEHSLKAEFFNEVRSAAVLNHSRITTVYDFGETTSADAQGSIRWLVMELVEGGTLKDLKGGLAWTELQPIVLDILSGLAHAHARRLIHRDIKPQNILVDATTNRIKITDFGLVRSLSTDGDHDTVHSDFVQGTPSYMAPEQILNESVSMGPWTDLYALGCLVWEMVCGKPPYQGTRDDIFRQHLRGIHPVFKPKFDVPSYLESWLKRLIQRSPNQRYQNAAQAQFGLLHAVEQFNILSVPTESRLVDFDDLDQPTQEFSSIFTLDDTIPVTTETKSDDFNYQIASVAGFQSGLHALQLPDSWQQRSERTHRLMGVGLKLLSMRALEMVGREIERDTIWSVVKQMIERRASQVLLLDGVSGIGKRSIAMWLAYRTAEVGVATWMLTTFEKGDDYRLKIIGALASHLGLIKLSKKDAHLRLSLIHRQLQMDFIEDVDDLLWLVANRDDPDFSKSLWKPDYFNALVSRFLIGLSNVEPIIWVVDGLHHAIEMSDLMESIITKNGMITMVATINSVRHEHSHLSEALEDLLKLSCVHSVSIHPLTSVEQVQFIQNLLGLSIEVATIIEQKSGGSPRVAIQLVTACIEQGGLIPSPEGFQLRDGQGMSIPDSILDVWRTRLQRLIIEWTEADLLTLYLGSILGKSVDQRELTQCLEMVDASLAVGMLEVLSDNGWIQMEVETGNWAFVDAIFREAILSHLEDTSQRQVLSSVVLDALFKQGLSTHRHAQLLTHAGRPLESLTPLFQSVRKAIVSYEIGRAKREKRLRDDILSLLTIEPDGRHAFETRALVMYLAPFQKRMTMLKTDALLLIEWAERLNLWEDLIELYSFYGYVYWNNGEVDTAERYLHQGLALARKHRSKSEISILQKLLFLSKNPVDSMAFAREALFLSEQCGDVRNIGSSYNSLGILSYRNRDYYNAKFFLHEALLRFEIMDHRTGLIDVYFRQGILFRFMKSFEQSEQAYLKALKLNQMLAHVSINIIFCQVNLVLVYTEMGRYPEVVLMINKMLPNILPELHPKLPNIALVIGFLCQALSLSIQQEWSDLEKSLAHLCEALQRVQFYDDDVYLFLHHILDDCTNHHQQICVRLVRQLLHDQYTREGLLEKAEQYV